MNQRAPSLGLASHLGRGVQRIATDAIVGRVRSLPRKIGDLDASSLTQIMGRSVSSVEVIGGVTSMTTADRQACERELLDDYRRVLASAGGPELDRDELWDRYRQGALYAYVAALITAGMGGMQAESIALEGLRRAVAALGDLDTVTQLEKSL